MKQLEPDVKKLETQLRAWAVKIDDFVVAVQKSNGWSRIDVRQRIDDLKVKRALCRAKLDEFVATGSAHRDDLKAGLNRVWKDLENTFKEMNL